MAFQVEEAVAVLSRTPATLDALMRDQTETWLHCREAPGTFSPMEVLGHLVYAELTDWIPRARIILECGESRSFDPFDRRGGDALVRGFRAAQVLDQFARLREGNLKELAGMELDAARLQAAGIHPELGRVTMENLLATWVAHDLGHIAQIVRVMSRQYRDAVGPWRQYLRLLG